MSVIKNIVLVIISPKIGWEEVDQSGFDTQKVLSSGFYPLLALLAVVSFAPMLMDATATLPKTLMGAIVEFASFFFTYFLASYLLGGFYPSLVKTNTAVNRLNNFIVYNLAYLVILEICNILLRNQFSPLYFMLLYSPVLIYKGTVFLGMDKGKKTNKFTLIASCLLILIPIIFRKVLQFMFNS